MKPRTTYTAAMKAESPLAELLCFDLYATSRSMTAAYRPLLEPLGLTYPQYLVMQLLWRHGERAIRELTTDLGLDHNTLSPLLKRLEARGLVTRTRRPEDERSVIVALTADGRALRARCRGIPDAIASAAGLPAKEIARLRKSLRALATNTAVAAQGRSVAW
jgi:DNA-binding MarR family transcriptional regulator